MLTHKIEIVVDEGDFQFVYGRKLKDKQELLDFASSYEEWIEDNSSTFIEYMQELEDDLTH